MNRKLTFKFNDKNLEIDLTEKEQKIFSNKSIFLNKDNEAWEINDSFFKKSTIVPDVFRYILKYNHDWSFLYPNNSNAIEFSIDNDKNEIDSKNHKNIILVLESPHKDEYEITENELTPRSPASGDSGKSINKLFTSHVLPMLISLGLELNKKDEYHFCIVNPVPFQTSLVHIHQKGLIAPIRDKIWKTMYPELKTDFETRLKKYKPHIILNGCTSNLKPLLNDELSKIDDCKIFNVTHPASWQRALSGFKLTHF